MIYYTPELLHAVKMTEIFDAQGDFYCYISLRLYFKLLLIMFEHLYYLEKLAIDFLMQKTDIAFVGGEGKR